MKHLRGKGFVEDKVLRRFQGGENGVQFLPLYGVIRRYE
jgi:hypothetical protein